jgi:glycosyltransferase involved in cell wall biosynthesis
VFSSELDGKTFDCVSAVDVLEHVPPEHRQVFLERLSLLGRNTLILGFPTSDSTDSLATDKVIDGQYRAIFGDDYPWLEEHHRFGLPSLSDTVAQLSRLGWHCQSVGHGHAPWLRELLGFVICVGDIPSMKDFILEISERFNKELYPCDFQPPYYRHFVIASRGILPQISGPVSARSETESEKIFKTLLEDARRSYFDLSLRQLAERDTQIAGLYKHMEKEVTERDTQIADLYKHMEKEVTERDAQIASLYKQMGKEVTERDALMTDKQAELMKMSDWAQGMAQDLSRRHASFAYRAAIAATRARALARKKIAQSFVGDLVRYVRNRSRFHAKRASLEAIRQSVLDNGGRLIVTFPIITWEFRWQRPQHIVSRLRDQGFSVIYLAMSISAIGRRLRNNKEALTQIQFNELAPHVNQIRLSSSKPLNVYADPVEGDDLHNISMELDALISELRPSSVIYLVQFPGWGPVAQELQRKWGGKVVFDCMDDHGGFSTNTAQALETEEALLKNADLVITSSNMLEERAKAFNPNTIQIKNGTEFEHFAEPIRNGRLEHLRDRPIIGYYGAISDWFDMGLVAYCASQRPDWNFVLIGATTGADMQPVEGLANVNFLGEIAYKELPGYLAYFDVCTIPFKIIPLTLATNPVKFYEYQSAGKPVVSVELPELLAYQEDCYLARDSNGFLMQLERALYERKDEIKIERRLKLAQENSWDARVSNILKSEIFNTHLHQ